MAARFPKVLAIRVPSDIDRRLRARARAEDLAVGQLVRRILSREATVERPAGVTLAPAQEPR